MGDAGGVRLFAAPGRSKGAGKKRKQRAADAEEGAAAPAAKQQQRGRHASPRAQQQQREQERQRHAEAQEHDQDAEQLPERGRSPASSSGDGAAAAAASFRELGVSDWLCSVLDSLGIKRPTQVQAGTIPAVLAGRNVIGTAHTGSGKTAAFALPMLQQLARDPYGVFGLVLTPTRELAMQLAEQFHAFGTGMSLKVATVIGGLEQQGQAQALARKPHIVIATPGRLAALLQADASLAAGFKRLAYLVLDEADRLLEASFEHDLRCVLGALPPPSARQSLLFSATLTAPLVKLQRDALGGDAHVFQAYDGLRTADKLEERYCFIPHKVKDVYLAHLLTHAVDALRDADADAPAGGGGGGAPWPRARSAIVFVSTCKGCQSLAQVLKELGLPAASLHSGKSQKQRLAALQAFKSETVPLLLATDVASRGLDIPSVDLVVNYDLPRLAADYVHRVGRTARAGRGGWAVSLITQYDVELVTAIEGHIGHKLSEFVLDEAAVLRRLGRVYAAKKAAALALLAAEDRAAVGSGAGRQRSKK